MLSSFVLLSLVLKTYLVYAEYSSSVSDGTIYYDLKFQCNGEGSAAVGTSGMNGGTNACGYSAASLGSSRIVAVNIGLFSRDKCGAEVTIMQNGAPVTFSEGPLFIGDICGGCGVDKVDFGAAAAIEMGDGVSCLNPSGFTYQISDQIIGPGYSSEVDGSLAAWRQGGGTGVTVNTTTPVASSATIGTSTILGGGAQSSSAYLSAAITTPSTSQAANPATQVSNPASQSVGSASEYNPGTAGSMISSLVSSSPTTQTLATTPSAAIGASTTSATSQIQGSSASRGSWGGHGGWTKPVAAFAEQTTDASTSDRACKRRKRRRLAMSH
ncbi:uncharacterized protein IL334_005114 [Kwoniella shivajii]|uniref:Expansin-like EG45 domain-containing protein n=1 Tax=Kwoniella shivajii TaxID=564305 RepID=A0ABZ1D286_9TREE|nr:hypothetical protein IL334_005114 [Kwoniella shivajii]